jgi:DNA-binding response OmpR family regulator
MRNMLSQPKVLVVDDELSTRVTIESILASESYELHFAENGVEALSMVAGIAPDIILLDVMMPGLSGFDVCKKIRSMPGRWFNCPRHRVDDRESRMAGMKAGADDFVTKPFDNHELRLRVQNMTRLNRYMQKALYNSIELKFYESFVDDQKGYNDQNTTQVNAISNIRDYIEAEEALMVLFDSENPELATKKLLGHGTTWKSEKTFLIKSSRLCSSMAQTITMIDYGSVALGEIEPVFTDIFANPIRNILLAPLIVNHTFLGAMIFINPLFEFKKDDRRNRFLQLMVKGVANSTFALEHTRQLTISKAALEASQWEILNSRNTLRTFFDNIPNCIYVIDRSYTILIINNRRSEGQQNAAGTCRRNVMRIIWKHCPCALCRVQMHSMACQLSVSAGAERVIRSLEITTIPPGNTDLKSGNCF